MNCLRLSTSDFILRDDESGIIVEIKNLYSEKDQLRCFLKISFGSAILFNATHNFFSVRGESEFLKYMKEQKGFESMNWKKIYNDIKNKIIDAFFDDAGEILDICDIETKGVKYYLYPYIAVNQPNILYGHGGNNKSTFAMALIYSLFYPTDLSVSPENNVKFDGNIVYLDYETDKSIIKSIYNSICEKPIPEGRLFYKKGELSIKEDKALKRLIVEKNIKLMIVDSIGLAAGGNLRDEEVAIAFFSSLRKLNTTLLMITHKNKSKDEEQSGGSMFGSVYFYNYARNIFEIEKIRDTNLVEVTHKKCNFDRLAPKETYEVARENGKTRFIAQRETVVDSDYDF